MARTHEELLAYIEQISKNIDKLSEAQKENAEAQRKNTETQKEISEAQKETSKQMKETDEKLEKIFADTNFQMKETDEKLKRIGIGLGNIGKNNGAVAEDFFYSSLLKNKKLGNIQYDDIGKSWEKNLKNVRGEYDIILINGNEIGLVEVKYKIHQDDVEKMENQIKNFKILFPDYKDYKIRGAFASLSMSKKAEDEILSHGYFALKQQGNHVEISSPLLS